MPETITVPVDPAAAVAPAQPPAPAPAAAVFSPPPLATLAYESGVDAARFGHSRWGIASCVLCGVTLVYTIVCLVGMSLATGWDTLGWAIIGFYGNWIGCGLALAVGLVGVLQRRRRRRWAVHGMWISAAIAAAPFVTLWVISVVRRGF
jgi:hypothetical protein